jgi:putative endonuclease
MVGTMLLRPYLMKQTESWIVYILELSNGKYYTGITNDLEERLKQHSAGKGSKIVKSFLPFKLIYTEKTINRSTASKREIEIKKLSRKEKERLVKCNQ